MNDRISGLLAALFFLLIGLGQIYLSLRLPGGLGLSIEEPGPGLFPMFVGVLMCLAATLYLIQILGPSRPQADRARKAPVDILLLIATIAGFILLLPRAGFVLTAFFLLLSTLSIYGMPTLWRRIATAGAMTAASYLVFTLLLRVNLPSPTWFN